MPRHPPGVRLAIAAIVLLILALLAHLAGGRLMPWLGHLHGR